MSTETQTQTHAPPEVAETLVRYYDNANQYAQDAANLAAQGWRPAFTPTHDEAWKRGIKGHSMVATVGTLGVNLLFPTKRNRLVVTYVRRTETQAE